MRYPERLLPPRSLRIATWCSTLVLLVTVPLATAAVPQARRSPAQREQALTRQVQEWRLGAPLPGVRWGAAGATTDGCRWFAIGGSDFDVNGDLDENLGYNPQTDAWTPRAPMPAARFGLTAATAGKFIVVAGGYSDTEGIADDTYVYDTETNTWRTRAPMPTPIATGAMAAAGGLVYMIGGDNGDGISNDTTYEYDRSTDTWTSRAPMPTARENAVGVALRNRIFVAGGVNASDPELNALDTFEMYNPATNTWTPRAPMAEARISPGIVTDGRYVIVYGGASSYGAPDAHTVGSVERYDPVTNTWTTLPDEMVSPVDGGAFAYVAGRLYSAGGNNVFPPALDTNQFLRIHPNPCSN